LECRGLVPIYLFLVVLFAMLYGTVPFKGNNMNELHDLIVAANYTLKDDVSEESRDLLKGLLESDPAKRLNMKQVLLHPWMRDAKDESKCSCFILSGYFYEH
jgi:serine/threonine protein kinase